MTSTTDFVSQVATDLRATRKVSSASNSAFGHLPAEARAAFQQMMIFVGSQVACLDQSQQTRPSDRADAIALMFLKFEIDTAQPKWSSCMLERMLEQVLNTPHGEALDIIRGFDLALTKYNVRLTQTVANLVKDIVVLTFTKARASYQAAEWDWANEELKMGISPARCYLFLHALPPDKADGNAIVGILRGLTGTPFLAQAVETLADDLERADVKPLLPSLKLPQLETK